MKLGTLLTLAAALAVAPAYPQEEDEAEAAPAGSALRGIGFEAARVHLDASLPHVAGDYMGEHWLASFALLALT